MLATMTRSCTLDILAPVAFGKQSLIQVYYLFLSSLNARTSWSGLRCKIHGMWHTVRLIHLVFFFSVCLFLFCLILFFPFLVFSMCFHFSSRLVIFSPFLSFQSSQEKPKKFCESGHNKRKDTTFHRDVHAAPLHTRTSTAQVGALIWSHLGDWITQWVPAGHRRYTGGRYDGRPWVGQPHEQGHATQVTDISVEHGWRPHKLGSGVKVRGTEARSVL